MTPREARIMTAADRAAEPQRWRDAFKQAQRQGRDPATAREDADRTVRSVRAGRSRAPKRGRTR